MMDRMMTYAYCFCMEQTRKVKEFFTKEDGEVNIVAIVVLIGIAVILAVFFKEQIMGLLETLIGTISGNAQDAVNGE